MARATEMASSRPTMAMAAAEPPKSRINPKERAGAANWGITLSIAPTVAMPASAPPNKMLATVEAQSAIR
ncbi:hypothetical protein KU6B_15740 [Mameliella alba]|nr:hypothetical protein KU6B_15740 [Mameliella alba]